MPKLRVSSLPADEDTDDEWILNAPAYHPLQSSRSPVYRAIRLLKLVGEPISTKKHIPPFEITAHLVPSILNLASLRPQIRQDIRSDTLRLQGDPLRIFQSPGAVRQRLVAL